MLKLIFRRISEDFLPKKTCLCTEGGYHPVDGPVFARNGGPFDSADDKMARFAITGRERYFGGGGG